jgi:glycosyltransferase involved in cell wall biosynthesis
MTTGEAFPGSPHQDANMSLRDLLSVVVPAHNEASGIAHAVEVISGVLAAAPVDFEIIVVDDGSRDGTFERIRELAAADPRVKGVRFTRNFGKEAALLAGLRAARGAAVVTIDSDLQHPPTLIPQMIEHWRDGAMVVDAVKRDRGTDGAITRGRARLFNALLSRLGGINLRNASDFKLLDRVVVDAITRELPERQRFYRGLADWVGYRHASIPFDVAARADGEGKWSLLKLFSLATTAIVSFTSAPLQIVTVLGFATLAFGFFVGADALIAWFQGRAVSGFATTIITLLIVGSFIMISLGIIGEYIAKIYDEIKARPPYLVEAAVGFEKGEALRIERATRPLAELLEPGNDS